MTITSIKSKTDLEEALKRIEDLWKSEPCTREGNELDALVTLVEDYELSNIVTERINQDEIYVDIDHL